MAGISLPQLAPASTDRVSGGLVVDGCLKFDGSKNQHLKRTVTSAGNRTTWTLSTWIKRGATSTNVNDQTIFEAHGGGNDTDFIQIKWRGATVTDSFNISGWATNFRISNKVFRDHSAWYHVVVSANTNDTSGNRLKISINGEILGSSDFHTSNAPGSGANTGPNGTVDHYIGYSGGNGGQAAHYYMSQTTFIDGVELGADYFAYADPLTLAWRPKKFKASGTTKNDGTQWSSFGSGTLANGNWGQAFDGNRYMYGGSGASNGPAAENGTITFAPPNLKGRYVRMGVRGGSNKDFTVNDKSMIFGTSNAEVATIDLGTTQTITSIKAISTSGGVWAQIYWIEVDGILLKNNTTTNLTFGTNGFYLPMDGNSLLGEDKSGNGNNWTPVNFGGSNTIDKATGAKPILNTGNGGNVARPGVFGSDVSAFYTTTSATNSGGKYVFENEGTQPTFSFIRGATYTFDYSASTGHPLRFATAADAAGSTQYTDGTSVSGNVIKFTVPHNAPDTLYYYCVNHGNMGNSISVTTDETKADPYAWKNVLALPLVGSAIDESKNLNCTQSAAKAVTGNGNVSAFNHSSNFYGGSYYFDGNGDYLTLANSADFAFSTGDFTIEAYIFPTNVTNYKNFYEGNTNGSTTASVRLQIKNTGVIEYLVNNVGRSTGAVVPASAWTHVALTRASNTVRLFVNGVNVDEYTNSGDLTSQSLQIGRTHDNYDYVGYIQDYRVYKGVAKYTSNFIPAAGANPNILPDSPSGVATKSKLKKITDGSVYFDGTNDYLSLANSSDFSFGSGDFTIEAYAYWESLSGTGSIIGVWQSSNTRRSWLLQNSGSGNLTGLLSSDGNSGGSLKQCDATGALSAKRWHHCAFTRSGNNIRLFLDGKLKATTDVTGFSVYDNTDDSLIVGSFRNDGAGDLMKGFISNVRVIKGTALYTSDFTPPIRKLTNVTNTKLLCCQSPTSSTEGEVKPGNITANGTTYAATLNPFPNDINAVRGQEGAYATFDPLQKNSGVTLTNGNLKLQTGSNAWKATQTTLGMKTGKFYWEFGPYLWRDNSNHCQPGVAAMNLAQGYEMGATNYTAFYHYTGTKYFNGPGGAGTAFGQAWNDSELNIIGIAFDADTRKVWFSRNGVWQGGGDPANGTSEAGTLNEHRAGVYAPTLGSYGSLNGGGADANFGQKPFKFPPPDGFQPLTSSAIRPDTVVTDPEQYVKANAYRGNGATSPGGSGGTQTINMGFKPDMIWIKDRTQAHNNNIIDSLNGAPNILMPDDASSSLVTNSTDGLTAFTDNGFTLGDNGEGTQSLELNKGGNNYVAWCWKAGGAPTATNTNTSGAMAANSVSIDGVLQSAYTPSGSPNKYPSKMSIGTKQGFSVVQWEDGPSSNKNIPHGLSEIPSFYIIKNVDAGDNYYNYTTNINGTLDFSANFGTATYQDSSRNFPTTSTVNFETASGGTHIMYCWHDVPGLHKSGVYIGSGSNNPGPVIDLGFRPSIILLKKNTNTDSNSGWHWYDNKRNTYNPANNFLLAGAAYYENRAQNNTADVSSYTVDFLSTGFRLSHSSNNLNYAGETYFYAAWAEAPAFNLYGAQSSAR